MLTYDLNVKRDVRTGSVIIIIITRETVCYYCTMCEGGGFLRSDLLQDNSGDIGDFETDESDESRSGGYVHTDIVVTRIVRTRTG